MAHHKHWTQRGKEAIAALKHPAGNSGNANHSGYPTATGRLQHGGNSGKAGSFEGPAAMESPSVASLTRTGKGGKHNGRGG